MRFSREYAFVSRFSGMGNLLAWREATNPRRSAFLARVLPFWAFGNFHEIENRPFSDLAESAIRRYFTRERPAGTIKYPHKYLKLIGGKSPEIVATAKGLAEVLRIEQLLPHDVDVTDMFSARPLRSLQLSKVHVR